MNVSDLPLAVLRTHGHITGQLSGIVRGVGELFYLRDPSQTSYEKIEQVPEFFRNAWPYFFVFIILENVILYLERRPVGRLNDSITSLSHGIIQECGRLVFRGGESAAYIYLYNNYRLFDLPWDSPWTWYLALICVDFCYYWVHRASHEILILWAQHQVHHSSEEYNLAVGMRQSLLQGWCSFVFYLPMALFVPPTHFLTHQQFNLIYQFWIHTKAVQTLGPLEYVLNTPQHHRVHHGCNLYCIDKNYGGFLIIWDRMFGTFAAERKKEEIVYGLVFQEPSFNPVFLQVFYNQYVVNKYKSMTGVKNKLSAIVKGPSWTPGSPWTGNHEDKIDIQTREMYNVNLPLWCNLYLSVHFLLVLVVFQQLASVYVSMTPIAVLGYVGYIILSLTTIGMLFDNNKRAALFELARCLIFLFFCRKQHLFSSKIWLADFAELFFTASVVICVLQLVKVLQIRNQNLRKKADKCN